MKKLIALLISMCMMVSLAACGGSSQEAAPAQPAESTAASVSDGSGKTLVVDIWDNNQLDGLQKIPASRSRSMSSHGSSTGHFLKQALRAASFRTSSGCTSMKLRSI